MLLLVAGLAWAPFWLGGDRRLPWGFNAVYFPALVLMQEAALFARGRPHPYAVKQIAVPAGLFLGVVIWTLAQISSYVPGTFAHPIWTMAGDALETTTSATISVNPGLTALALMRLLTDASVFWLALQLSRNVERSAYLLRGIGLIVAAYAAYGLLLAALFGGAIPLFNAVDSGGFVRSTFVNRNSFATYAGLGLVVVIAVTLRLYRHAVPEAAGLGSYRLTKFLEATGRRGAFWLGAGVVILVALLGSVSRGGILSTALGVFALLALSFGRRRRRRGEHIETIIFVTAAIVAVFLFFGDRIVGRIASVGLEDASRMSVDTIVVHAIQDSPLLGFGYGAFADVFPLYRDQSISPFGVWDMAHNTYLEVFLGLGLIGGAALIGAVGWLAVKCLIGAVKRRSNATAPLVATSAALLVGAHALVDFSLQIEAVALTFSALLGIGVAQSESSRLAASD